MRSTSESVGLGHFGRISLGFGRIFCHTKRFVPGRARFRSGIFSSLQIGRNVLEHDNMLLTTLLQNNKHLQIRFQFMLYFTRPQTRGMEAYQNMYLIGEQFEIKTRTSTCRIALQITHRESASGSKEVTYVYLTYWQFSLPVLSNYV